MKKHLCRIFSICIILCVLLVSLTTTTLALGENVSKQYEQALELLKDEKYTEAAEAFDSLGTYADSPKYAMYCRANAAGEAGLFQVAITNLSSLGQFLDSSLLTTYYAGLSWEVSETYEKAIEILSSISLYRDVPSRLLNYPALILDRDYRKADAAEQAGNLDAALKGFKDLGDYKDSAARAEAVQQKIYERQYNTADAAEQNNDLVKALEGFTALGDYSDSKDRAAAVQGKINENTYQNALEFEAAEDYFSAYDLFLSLGNYKDSIDRAKSLEKPAKYAKGLSLIAKGDYSAAYTIFDGLGDYEDSILKAYALSIADFTTLNTIAPGVATYLFHDLHGFINFNENVLWEPQWSEVKLLSADRIAVNRNDKYGVLDISGEFVSSPQWTSISQYNADGICVIENSSGFGLMNYAGEVITPYGWNAIGDSTYYATKPTFYDGLISVRSITGKYGYVSQAGELVIPARYDGYGEFSNGLAAVKSGSKWGFIDTSGKTVISFNYEEVYSFNAQGTTSVLRDGKWQIIDMTGKVLYFNSTTPAPTAKPSARPPVKPAFKPTNTPVIPSITVKTQATVSLRDIDGFALDKVSSGTTLTITEYSKTYDMFKVRHNNRTYFIDGANLKIQKNGTWQSVTKNELKNYFGY